MMFRTILSALILIFVSKATAFTASPISRPLAINRNLSRNPTQVFLFGPPKDDGSPGDYVCQDCGYVFTKGPKAWAALPDNYSCPPCGSTKRRFKKVPKGSANQQSTQKKGWFS